MRTKSAHAYAMLHYAHNHTKSLQTIVMRIPSRVIRATGQLVYIDDNKLIDGQGFTERGAFCSLLSIKPCRHYSERLVDQAQRRLGISGDEHWPVGEVE